MIRLSSLAVMAGVLLTGCANLEPTYHRPAPSIPASWPTGPAYPATTDSPVADWRQVFPDPRLGAVIQQALDNNRDLRVAIAQIQASRAEYHVQRADLAPTIDGSFSAASGRTYTGLPASFGSAYATATTYSASVASTSYELDLFGRVHSLTRAALETYLATEEARRSVQISLVAEVATDYLTFGSDASLLDVSRTTVVSAQANLDLARRRMAGGVASELDVSNAETILDQAQDDVARYTTQLAQDKNALDLVVGAPVAPANLPSGVDDPATRLGAPPAALNSRVLLQRPDVLEAEHSLRSANASIGAARAAFFPSISLTGSAARKARRSPNCSPEAPGSGVSRPRSPCRSSTAARTGAIWTTPRPRLGSKSPSIKRPSRQHSGKFPTPWRSGARSASGFAPSMPRSRRRREACALQKPSTHEGPTAIWTSSPPSAPFTARNSP